MGLGGGMWWRWGLCRLFFFILNFDCNCPNKILFFFFKLANTSGFFFSHVIHFYHSNCLILLVLLPWHMYPQFLVLHYNIHTHVYIYTCTYCLQVTHCFIALTVAVGIAHFSFCFPCLLHACLHEITINKTLFVPF